MFGVLAGFGLGMTATKYVAEYRENDPVYAGNIASFAIQFAIVSGAIFSLVLYLAAPWLASYSLNAPHLSEYLKISALVLFFSAVNGAQTGILAGLEEFKSIAKINFIVGVASFLSLVILTNYGALSGAVWALVANVAFGTVINAIVLSKKVAAKGMKINLLIRGEGVSVVWKFSLPAALSGMLVGPVNWVCGAFLVNQESGYVEMGLYSIAQQWNAVILFIPGLVGQVVLPLLTNLSSPGNSSGQYKRVVLFNVLINGLVAVLLVIPILIFAPNIIDFYGRIFEGAIQVLRVTAMTAVLMAINSVVGSALASKGKMWGAFLLNLIWAITILICAKVSSLYNFGALGLAYSALSAYVMHTLWQFVYLRKCLN